MLKIKNLTKHFGGLVAINNINVEVHKGDILGLIGPNGAGKTTLFNLISGFLRPSKGNIIFNGHDITCQTPSRISSLGLVRTFQSSLLFQQKSVFDNVMGAHHLQRKSNLIQSFLNTSANRKERDELIKSTEKMLEITRLSEVKEDVACDLPHGLQRMLGVAIALACKPKLLLLDEPITGMTHLETEAMMALIKEVNKQGITIILVEHHLKQLMDISNRIVVLNFGVKLAEGSGKEVRENEEVIQAYLGA